MKNKMIIKSDVEFRVKDEVETEIVKEVKKIVDAMSVKFMRNIEVSIKVDVE